MRTRGREEKPGMARRNGEGRTGAIAERYSARRGCVGEHGGQRG